MPSEKPCSVLTCTVTEAADSELTFFRPVRYITGGDAAGRGAVCHACGGKLAEFALPSHQHAHRNRPAGDEP